jgi:hypothetical protein
MHQALALSSPSFALAEGQPTPPGDYRQRSGHRQVVFDEQPSHLLWPRLCVNCVLPVADILATVHGAGHEGVQKTLHCLRASTMPTPPSSSKTTSRVMLCVSAISPSISIRQDSCNPSSCLVRCGPTKLAGSSRLNSTSLFKCWLALALFHTS